MDWPTSRSAAVFSLPLRNFVTVLLQPSSPRIASPVQLIVTSGVSLALFGRSGSSAGTSCVRSSGGTDVSSLGRAARSSVGSGTAAGALGSLGSRTASIAAAVQPAVATTIATIATICQNRGLSERGVPEEPGDPGAPAPSGGWAG